MLDFTHPELRHRVELTIEDCWARGWDVYLVSTTRSESYQRWMYGEYLAGRFPNIVANPDRDAGWTPFGWRARGSLHMIQQDGYSHAVDFGKAAYVPTLEFQQVARRRGLDFPEPTEWWHAQAFDAYSNGFYPMEDDMNKQEFADAIGAEIPAEGPYAGKVCVRLLDRVVRDADGRIIDIKFEPYPLALGVQWLHQENKLARLTRPGNTELS